MTAAGLWLERARPEDALALARLERRCYTHPWSFRHFADALANHERTRVLVLRGAAAPDDPEHGIVAYCVAEEVVDEMHLHNLAVRPEDRGRGLARWLLKQAIDAAHARGARAALLEVRASNWPAIQLYRKAGFRTVSVRRDYYVRPVEDALVLANEDLAAPAAAAHS